MSDDTQKLIQSLKRKRSSSKAAIKRVESFCSNSLNVATIEDINIRLELLESAYSEFKELDERLMNYDIPSEIEDQEGRYCKLKAALKTEATKKNVAYQQLHQQFNATMRTFVQQQRDYFDNLHEKSSIAKDCFHDEIRLPKITITLFSGNYANFPSFKDLYESSIHKNLSLPKIHKFKYLKSLLVGDAASLVKHIQITDGNYDNAWEKICKRYDHKDHIMHTLITQFLEQALGSEAETRDYWLIYLLVQKCDEDTKHYWALQSHDKPFPRLEAFIEFLNKRSDALEKSEPTSFKRSSRSTITSANVNVETNRLCPLCSDNHGLSKCERFKEMDVITRRGFISEKGLCFNCMGRHMASRCWSYVRCVKCQRRHHQLLLPEVNETPTKNEVTEGVTSNQGVQNLQIGNSCKEHHTILPTVLLRMKDVFGKLQMCRALLNSRSQASFIDASFFQQLGLPKRCTRISISGLATSNIVTEGCTTLEFMARNKTETMYADFLILKTLPLMIPALPIKLTEAEGFEDIELADPKFLESGKIDMIIGAGVFFNLLRDGKTSQASLVAQNTFFGYVISGGIQATPSPINLNLEFNVDHTLRLFREQEELTNDEGGSLFEEQIETHYNQHLRRDETGRFIVKLPFKPNADDLGNSSHVAKKRFFNMERSLLSNTELGNEYRNFMAEYEELGHMRG